MRNLCILTSLAILLVYSSCGSKEIAAEKNLPSAPALNQTIDKAINNTEGIQNAAMMKKVGNLRIQVENQKAFRNRIDSLLLTMNAWVAKEAENKSSDFNETNLTIKVPVASFDRLINLLCTHPSTVHLKEIETEDMNAQHTDLVAQINSRNTLKQRYLELLSRAGKMSDMLEIEQKIGNIQEEINRMESNRILMEHQVTYSTINLSFYNSAIKNEPGYFARLFHSVSRGWHFLLELTIDLAILWPLSLAGILILFIARKKSYFQYKKPI